MQGKPLFLVRCVIICLVMQVNFAGVTIVSKVLVVMTTVVDSICIQTLSKGECVGYCVPVIT